MNVTPKSDLYDLPRRTSLVVILLTSWTVFLVFILKS